MTIADPKKIDAMIKAGDLPSLMLLWGEDSVSILRYQRKLEALAVTAFPDFNRYSCDGRSAVNVDALADSALSLPVMAPRRFALIDDLNPNLLSASDLEKLRQLAGELPEETLLLITVRTSPELMKKRDSKGPKVLELCDKHGVVCSLARPGASALAQTAMEAAKRAGAPLAREDALLLAEYCGRDPQRVITEAQKLAAHSPEGITAEDIRQLVAPAADARVFDLADKIVAKNHSAAMATIEELIFLREDPVTILSILSMAFVDMYRAAAARKEGIPPAEAKKALGYSGSGGFRYDRGVENQRRFSLPMLRDILALLARADSQMKQSGPDPRVTLEAAVAEIFRRMEGI